jgi:hypothetical protein
VLKHPLLSCLLVAAWACIFSLDQRVGALEAHVNKMNQARAQELAARVPTPPVFFMLMAPDVRADVALERVEDLCFAMQILVPMTMHHHLPGNAQGWCKVAPPGTGRGSIKDRALNEEIRRQGPMKLPEHMRSR